jgi:thymidylate kinase
LETISGFDGMKTKNKMLVTLSGIDGSGKSTIAQLIQDQFPGFKIIHIVQFRLVNKLFKKSKINIEKKSNPGSKSWVGLLNLGLLVFDSLLFRFYFWFSSNPIICDRYFYDLFATHIYRYGNSRFLKLISSFFPKPSLAFFIEVPAEIARERETEGTHTLGYLSELKNIYQERLLTNQNIIVLKNESLNSTVSAISNKIREFKNEK